MAEFELHRLGWHDFQQLCHTVAREVLGQTVEMFLSANDAGRDGAFTGIWSAGHEDMRGRFVLQCKHTTRPGKTLKPGDLRDEIGKATRLAAAGRCDIYLLMTNAGLSGRAAEKLEDEFARAGISQTRFFGPDWLNLTLTERKRLRMLVPRVYGLGDLTQILDERSYRQAEAVLEALRPDLAKVVRTGTYERAAEALDRHGFVLLLGEPAAGKSTIAAQLSLAAADVYGASVVKLDTAGEFSDRWSPDEPTQFFWLDDAFGTTQLEVDLARSWTRVVPRLQAAIATGTRVVVTSRDYVFQAARPHLKPGAFPLLHESKVVVDVHDLTQTERRQILYNHLKHGEQPRDFLERLMPHLDALADHPGFSPELARRLAQPAFTKEVLASSRLSVEAFFERPRQFLGDVLEGLDVQAHAALGLIYLHRNFLTSPVQLTETDQELISRLGSDLGGITSSLQVLDGSLVRHTRDERGLGWTFAHPTMADAYAARLRTHPELLHLYVGCSELSTLLRTTTCGDVGVREAIVLGENFYDLVIDRLTESPVEGWHDQQTRLDYLVYRCDKAFLRRYLQRDPETLDSVSEPGLMLEAVPETRLAVRLQAEGLLPDEIRRQFVETIVSYLIRADDSSVLTDAELRRMLTTEEFAAVRRRLETEFIDDLRNAFWNWEMNYQRDYGSPDDYIRPFSEVLDAVAAELPESKAVQDACAEARGWVDRFVHETEWAEHEPEQSRVHLSGDSESTEADSRALNRSVFDDLVE
jgi:hypothetical protein